MTNENFASQCKRQERIFVLNFSKILFLIFIFISVFSLAASQAFADVAVDGNHFPDKNFREIVSADFDSDHDGTLTDAELDSVTEMNLSNKNISRLNGIEYFTKLEVLSCDQNNLTNIDLSKNTALVSLNCNWNYLTRLDVSNSPNLSTLAMDYNDISVLNVSNTALTSLRITNSFQHNDSVIITGIYARDCTNLEQVRINNSDYNFRIDNLDLSGCTSLTKFYMNGRDGVWVYIKNLNLSGCTALVNLGSSYNSSLEELQLESLDLSGCTALVSLDVSKNNLTQLDVSGCTALEYLDCSQNKLTMLDLTNNTALTSVTCANQNPESQKITVSGSTYKFDFSSLIPSANIPQIAADSVHAYTSEGSMIETQYSGGVATFAFIPAEIEYEFATGFGDVNISVTFKATTGGGSGGITVKAPVILTTTLDDGISGIGCVRELYATGTPVPTWALASGTLPDGLVLDESGIISGTPTSTGTFEFTVTATNTAGTATKTLTLTIGESKINSAPEITSSNSALAKGTVGSEYGCYVSATGARPVIWAVISRDSGLGWLNIDSDGQLTGTPTESGDFNFTVQAQNAVGIASKDLTLTVSAAPEKTRPTILTSELEPGMVGKNYGLQLMASGTPSVKWSITKGKLPKGVELSSRGGFSGIIPKAGKVTFTVKAENEYGSYSKIFTLQSYVAPNIDLSSFKDAKVWKKYTGIFRTKPTATKPLTWELEGDLPPGLTFDASKGKITGTASKNGAFPLRIKACNPADEDVKIFTFNSVADLPKFTLGSLPKGTDGKSYKAAVKTTGTKTITYSLEGYLPDGLNFDEATGTISGTPDGYCDNRKIKITASNMAGKVSKEYYLTIKGVAPKFTTKSLADGMINSAYSVSVDVAGTKPVTVTQTGLPKGLEFNADESSITGTPTESGTFSVVLTASNPVKTVTKKYKLNIVSPPVFNNVTLTDATAGTSYNATFTASGTKKITYSISDGSLPTGMKLNASSGKLNGKPTAAGTFAFTVTAANPYGSASKEFSLTVKAVEPTITTSSIKKGKVGQSYSVTFKVSKQTTAPVIWTIDEELPGGLDFNSNTGILSGTPTAAYNGNITVRAANSAKSVSKTFSLTITGTSTKSSTALPESSESLTATPQDVKDVQRIFIGNPRKISDVKNLKILENYKIAAVLPEIFVTESGLYDFDTEISEDIETGAELIWLACPQNAESSDDDEIAEFYDSDGKEILTIPENHKITVGAWFNENVIYAPVIAVKKE